MIKRWTVIFVIFHSILYNIFCYMFNKNKITFNFIKTVHIDRKYCFNMVINRFIQSLLGKLCNSLVISVNNVDKSSIIVKSVMCMLDDKPYLILLNKYNKIDNTKIDKHFNSTVRVASSKDIIDILGYSVNMNSLPFLPLNMKIKTIIDKSLFVQNNNIVYTISESPDSYIQININEYVKFARNVEIADISIEDDSIRSDNDVLSFDNNKLVSYLQEKDLINRLKSNSNDSISINSYSNEGMTLLHLASIKGLNDVVKLLIYYNVNINLICTNLGSYGQTAIFYAILNKNEELVLLLTANNANVKILNSKGQSPLSLALASSNYNIIQAVRKNEIIQDRIHWINFYKYGNYFDYMDSRNNELAHKFVSNEFNYSDIYLVPSRNVYEPLTTQLEILNHITVKSVDDSTDNSCIRFDEVSGLVEINATILSRKQIGKGYVVLVFPRYISIDSTKVSKSWLLTFNSEFIAPHHQLYTNASNISLQLIISRTVSSKYGCKYIDNLKNSLNKGTNIQILGKFSTIERSNDDFINALTTIDDFTLDVIVYDIIKLDFKENSNKIITDETLKPIKKYLYLNITKSINFDTVLNKYNGVSSNTSENVDSSLDINTNIQGDIDVTDDKNNTLDYLNKPSDSIISANVCMVNCINSLEILGTQIFEYINKYANVNSDNNCDLQNLIPVGLDCEWKPDKKKSDHNKVALLQISIDSDIYLIDLLTISLSINQMTLLNTILQQLFSCNKFIIIGVSINEDIKKLRQSYPNMNCFHSFRYVCDFTRLLQRFVGSPFYNKKDSMGLSKLTNELLGYHLNKSQQCSQWDRRPLTIKQIEYGALDTIVLVKLYDLVLHRYGHHPSFKQALQSAVGSYNKY